MDKAMTILERLDQERLFTAEWIKRVESQVKKHEKEINQLKENLGVS